jgi:hypothetical protein
MKPNLVIIFSLMVFLGCNSRKDTTSEIGEKELADIQQKEAPTDSLGERIATIGFKVKATGEDLKTFDDGVVPWISLENPDSEIGNLIDADVMVLQSQKVTIIIDYPLNNPATFEMTTIERGFTRKQLIQEVSKRYHEIYKLEENSATTKTVPMDKREGLINRNQTDGKFGVWGHDLSDLDLGSIEVHQGVNGKVYLVLLVES